MKKVFLLLESDDIQNNTFKDKETILNLIKNEEVEEIQKLKPEELKLLTKNDIQSLGESKIKKAGKNKFLFFLPEQQKFLVNYLYKSREDILPLFKRAEHIYKILVKTLSEDQLKLLSKDDYASLKNAHWDYFSTPQLVQIADYLGVSVEKILNNPIQNARRKLIIMKIYDFLHNENGTTEIKDEDMNYFQKNNEIINTLISKIKDSPYKDILGKSLYLKGQIIICQFFEKIKEITNKIVPQDRNNTVSEQNTSEKNKNNSTPQQLALDYFIVFFHLFTSKDVKNPLTKEKIIENLEKQQFDGSSEGRANIELIKDILLWIARPSLVSIFLNNFSGNLNRSLVNKFLNYDPRDLQYSYDDFVEFITAYKKQGVYFLKKDVEKDSKKIEDFLQHILTMPGVVKIKEIGNFLYFFVLDKQSSIVGSYIQNIFTSDLKYCTGVPLTREMEENKQNVKNLFYTYRNSNQHLFNVFDKSNVFNYRVYNIDVVFDEYDNILKYTVKTVYNINNAAISPKKEDLKVLDEFFEKIKNKNIINIFSNQNVVKEDTNKKESNTSNKKGIFKKSNNTQDSNKEIDIEEESNTTKILHFVVTHATNFYLSDIDKTKQHLTYKNFADKLLQRESLDDNLRKSLYYILLYILIKDVATDAVNPIKVKDFKYILDKCLSKNDSGLKNYLNNLLFVCEGNKECYTYLLDKAIEGKLDIKVRSQSEFTPIVKIIITKQLYSGTKCQYLTKLFTSGLDFSYIYDYPNVVGYLIEKSEKDWGRQSEKCNFKVLIDFLTNEKNLQFLKDDVIVQKLILTFLKHGLFDKVLNLKNKIPSFSSNFKKLFSISLSLPFFKLFSEHLIFNKNLSKEQIDALTKLIKDEDFKLILNKSIEETKKQKVKSTDQQENEEEEKENEIDIKLYLEVLRMMKGFYKVYKNQKNIDLVDLLMSKVVFK